MQVQINIQASKKDWIEFNKKYMRRSNKTVLAILLSFIMIAILIESFYLIPLLKNMFQQYSGTGQIDFRKILNNNGAGSLIYLFVLLLFICLYRSAIRLYIKNKAFLPEHKYISEPVYVHMNTENIFVQTGLNEAQYVWDSITQIVIANDYISIFPHAVPCILLPKKAIHAQQQATVEELIAECFNGKLVYIK